ncbi:14223_t:CDS:2 [Entrophospora sp. SA101]|nr:14223_t:CDS:2 [Entrophospora sp. SA101]
MVESGAFSMILEKPRERFILTPSRTDNRSSETTAKGMGLAKSAGEKDPVELDSSGRLKEVQASPNEWCGCIFRGPFRSSMFETRGTKRVATGKLACGSQAERELSSDRRETRTHARSDDYLAVLNVLPLNSMGNLLKLYRGGDRALKLNALQRGIPSKRKTSTCVDYVPALFESSYAFSTVKSHDKVSVGQPAEGSF